MVDEAIAQEAVARPLDQVIFDRQDVLSDLDDAIRGISGVPPFTEAATQVQTAAQNYGAAPIEGAVGADASGDALCG